MDSSVVSNCWKENIVIYSRTLPDSLSKHSVLKPGLQFSVAVSASSLGFQTKFLGTAHYFHILSRIPADFPIAGSARKHEYILSQRITFIVDSIKWISKDQCWLLPSQNSMLSEFKQFRHSNWNVSAIFKRVHNKKPALSKNNYRHNILKYYDMLKEANTLTEHIYDSFQRSRTSGLPK